MLHAGATSAGRCRSEVAGRPSRRRPARPATPRRCRCARFDRDRRHAWRRTSYSALTAAAGTRARRRRAERAARPTAEPTRTSCGGRAVDRPELAETVARDPAVRPAPAGRDRASPMADLPAGATFGTLVHAVLEHADPQRRRPRRGAARARARSSWCAGRCRRRRRARWPTPWCRCCDTPARPAGRRARAARHRAGDRLPSWTSSCRWPAATAAATRAARGRARRPGAAAARAPAGRRPAARRTPTRWPRRALGGQALRGYLTGCIDVVLRVPDGAGAALPGRRLQDQLARRPARRAADRPTTTGPRRWPRRWATPTTRCRRCCTPWRCTATCAGGSPATTRRGTSAACSTSSCAACAARTRRSSTASRAGCSRWRPPVALVVDAVRPARRGPGDGAGR